MSVFPSFRARPGACAVAVLVSLAFTPASAADEFNVSPAQMQSLGVQVRKLDKPAAIEGVTLSARVALPPRQDQVLSAPVAGVVDQLLVSDNDSVKTGQPLLRLTGPELGELQLKLIEAGSRSRLSAATLQRERQLFSEGVVPERRVLEAQAAAAEDDARRRHAEAALRLAGLDAAAIRKVAEGEPVGAALVLRAPSDGVVSDLKVKPGQRVSAAEALLHVADMRRLWIDVQVPLARQGELRLAKGTPLAVVGRDLRATALSVSSGAGDNQTLTLRAELAPGASGLRVGEFLQVKVPFAAAKDGAAWAVPLGAVMRDGDKAYVFVRTAKGFVARPVTVLASAGQDVNVQGELQAGQEIATTSVIALKAAWQGKGGAN
jgi:membrane fusion protein, heavy metal efflux system